MKSKFVRLVLLAVLGLLWGQGVGAADALVGDGTPASCTEAAFDAALAAASGGGGTITFNCGAAVATIPLTSAKNLTTGDVTVDGANRIILSAGTVDRHFFVGSAVTLRLQRIVLRDGKSAVGGGVIEASGAHIVLESVQLLNNYAPNQGGAIYCYVGTAGTLAVSNSHFENNNSTNGGAIYNDGCVATITDSTFASNQATAAGGAIHNAFNAPLEVSNSLFEANNALDGGGLFVDTGSSANLLSVTLQANTGGHGGGVENSGTLTLTQSLLADNTVTGSGGGLWNNAGGVMTLRQTTVRNNSAYEGGGVNSGGQLEMFDVNLVGNVATGSHGGGLYHGGGTAFITNATISGNMANGSTANGGGIYQNSNDNLTLTNVTLANNQAGLLGGGFYHYGRYAVLTNVTIANNTAGVAGPAIYEDSPMTPVNPGVLQMVNSLILGSSNNCDGPAFQSFGYNISSGACTALSDATDQENYAGDLLLGPLAFNGGMFAMQTILPQAGSLVIDAANPAQCPSLDQRSAIRVGSCDIGAVEYGAMAFRGYLPMVVR